MGDYYYVPGDLPPIPPATRETWFIRRGLIWRGAKEAYWWSPADNICGHRHREGLRFDLNIGLQTERPQRVFPGGNWNCKCWSIPIYEENGVRVGKDRFNRNVSILTALIGAFIVSMVFFFAR